MRRYSMAVFAVLMVAFSVAILSACGTAAPTATPVPTVAPGQPATPVPVVATPTPTPSSAVQPVQGTPSPQRGGILRYARELGDLDTMDPQLNRTYSSLLIFYEIYNNLVTLNTDGTLGPELAKSWDISSDGKAVTLHLQQGVKFQNGEIFDASVVKWNFDRMLDPKVGSPQLGALAPYINSIKVVDNNTIAFNLKEPYRPFLAFLTDRPGFVIPPNAMQNDPKAFGQHPVGSGPFKLTSWVPKGDVQLERFSSYWENGKPYLDGIHFQAVPDDTVRLAMIRTGETDVIDEVRITQLPLVKSNPNVKVYSYESGRVHSWKMTVSKPPYDNKALRQAMAYATDRQEFANVFYDGEARPAYTLIGFGWAYDTTFKPMAFDVNKAKEALSKAGYPNGGTFPLWCQAATTSIERCEIWQAQLKKIGINMDIKQVAASDYWSSFYKSYKGERSLLGWTWWNPRADPQQLLYVNFYSTGGSNSMDYNNPELDKLLVEAGTVYDIAKAKSLYNQVQTIIAEDAPHIFFVYETINDLTSVKVQDFKVWPDLWIRFKDAWLSK